MGWDYTHATHYTRTGAIDRKTEIDELYTWQNDTRKAEVVRSAMVGSTYYAAIKITELSTGETETAAAVALTHTNSRDYFNFGVKTMGESIELLKHAAAYQFKRPFWFCQSSGCYMPATRIPANYEVVTA